MRARPLTRHLRYSILPLAVAGLGACAGTTTIGARPHDMSLDEHVAAAQREAKIAAEHRSQYDPDAQEEKRRCVGVGFNADGACTKVVVNPTEEHLQQAELHQQKAADHLAAGQALRDAESEACEGIAPARRDQNPLLAAGRVLRVEPIADEGALLMLAPGSDATEASLQRSIDCHLARMATLGFEEAKMPHCPLALSGVTAEVDEREPSLAVRIEAEDPKTAVEVLRRSRALSRQ